MENRRALTISLAAAIIAALAFWYYVRLAVDREIGDQKKKELILKAKVDIPAGTRIDKSMLVEAFHPVAFIPPKAAQSAAEVLGQVAVATIFEGEPMLTSKLIPFDESSLNRRIPEGMRALTIGIRDPQDVVGVGGMLRPGHYVDILVTLFVSSEEIEKGRFQKDMPLKAETRTVFQNVQILAVGKDARLETASVTRNNRVSGEADLTNKNITVVLSPEDAQRLVLTQAIGRITLTLRRFNDTQIVNLAYIDPFRAFGIKLPVMQGPAPAYREIRGGQVVAAPF